MKTVAVIFGGQSTEHDVSIITALASIIKPLELSGEYRVEAVYIAKDGSWFWDDKLKEVSLFQNGGVDAFMQKAPKVMLQFDNGLTLVKSSQFAGRKAYRKIDVVFPAMHGTHGEDGELMGLLELAGVAYVGCEVPASVLAMDKVLAKLVSTAQGVPTNKWLWFTSREFAERPKDILARIESLHYPLFVKPAHLGSSIGISRVTDPSQLLNALEVAAHYDDKVLVEEAVQNLIEITLPVMGNEEPIAAFLEQPLMKEDDFFDFDTKYMKGGKGGAKGGAKMGGEDSAQGYSKIPADIPADLYQKAEKVGLDVYKALGCMGFARIDMLIDGKTGQVYFNEVNPMPGSLYAHNWRQKGISNVDLVTRLIRYGEERLAAKQRLQTSFATSFLKQF
jgi:D-alanine-D-alanine ligase